MAQLNIEKADYMAKAFLKIKGFIVLNRITVHFNEFVVELPRPVKEVNEKLLAAGFYWWL